MKEIKGITLIALVVTIVVLLILAGVSLNLVIGNNGIITQGKNAKEAMEQKKVEEAVELAISTLIIENNGSKSGITPKDIADQVKKENSQYKNVYAEDEMNYPTNIIFPEENRKVEVNLEANTGNLDEIYDTDLSEEDIARADLFEYEIISDEETGETNGFDSLPTKTARITGLNPKYCNNVDGGYTAEDGKNYADTNYEIILEDGIKISDTLVIPYSVEINGEMYKITEARIVARSAPEENSQAGGPPEVKTIIFPNTIEKLDSMKANSDGGNQSTTKIILPQNLKYISPFMFSDFQKLQYIEIPEGVTTIPESSFDGCSALESIKIPQKVTTIEDRCFNQCTSLNTVYYGGTMEEWKKINISTFKNYNLTDAQIICSDGTI